MTEYQKWLRSPAGQAALKIRRERLILRERETLASVIGYDMDGNHERRERCGMGRVWADGYYEYLRELAARRHPQCQRLNP